MTNTGIKVKLHVLIMILYEDGFTLRPTLLTILRRKLRISTVISNYILQHWISPYCKFGVTAGIAQSV